MFAPEASKICSPARSSIATSATRPTEGMRFPPETCQSRILAPRAGPFMVLRGRWRIRLQAWDTFAEICGSAAAALTGLLFVAVSIRIAYIARSQELRNRAAQTLSLFGTVLIISVLVAIPRQAYRTLGAELVVLAVITGTGLYILDRRAKGDRSNQAIAPALEAVTPITVTSLLLLAAGIVLVLGVPAGLYVLVGPVVVALASGVASAWLFLTKITE
jgi:hypothetical protein